MMKEDKTAKQEELKTAMDQLSAEITELSTSIKENTEAVASLEAEIEAATEQRQEEKAENSATIKDAEDAEPEPELWEGGESGAYKGTSGGSDVIGLLTDIAADFASMEAGARVDETTQQEEYDTWLTGAQIDKSQKQKDSEMKEARKGRLSEKLEAKTGDHSHVTKELEATVQYEKDLQHACVDGDSTYADRKAARTQEITALKEAQKILENAFNEPEEEAPAE